MAYLYAHNTILPIYSNAYMITVMVNVPKRILVVRNDKLGDFMLSYPALLTLKYNLPDTQLHVLVSAYTSPMAKLCPAIDKVHIDPGQQSSLKDILKLSRLIQDESYDAVITLYSTTRIGFVTWLAGIPYRLAPATKLAQIFYPRRLKQQRSRSEKPEAIYNRDLADLYLQDLGISSVKHPVPPFLEFSQSTLNTIRDRFIAENNIPAPKKLVFIHPGSGGSANNLSISQFAELAHALGNKGEWQLVISAGPNEDEFAQKLSSLTKSLTPVIYHSLAGLEQFAQHLAIANLFISGSTGPLHIAGALDIPTAAFYTRRRSATALRWQTLNSETKRLAFSPPATAQQEDMQSIDIAAAAKTINQTYLGG